MSRLTNAPRAAWRTLRTAVRSAGKAPGVALRAARVRPRAAYLGLGIAAVVLAGATATFAWLTVRDADIANARTVAVSAAEEKVVKLLSYDHRSLQADQESRGADLTGTFKNDYVALLRDVVAPAATQQQLSTRSAVVSSSVVDAQGTDTVTVLLFLNQTSQSAAKKDPTMTGSRVRVSMNEVDGDWLVSGITPV